MHCIRCGTGKPLLLIHGLGGSWRSWQLVIDKLADAGREVIAIDLPGHGATPPLDGEVSIRTLADAVTEYLRSQNLLGIDAVGSSMSGRLVLELARRGGVVGAVVALDPGGFWQGWEVPAFYYSVAGSVRLVRLLQSAIPAVTSNPIGRTALLLQFSARPWSMPSALARDEMRSFADSHSFDELLRQLAYGARQQGAPRGSIREPLVIGWGREDRVCLPQQAKRAQTMFPDARLHWFEHCGHFPQWDVPEQTAQLILAATAGENLASLTHSEPARKTKRRNWAAAAGVGLALTGGSLLAAGGLLAAGSIWFLRRRAQAG